MPNARDACRRIEHAAGHEAGVGRSPFAPAPGDLLRVGSRRWFVQTGLAGLAGLSTIDLLRARACAAATGASTKKRAVLLFWLSGGPSHLDMWDPKPLAPSEVRGPFGTIGTRVPGIEICEHLPKTASIMDKLTILRSVDCSASNHTPITMQAGNPLARRTDDGRDGGGYPSMGSIVARFRGANDPSLPAFVGLAESWKADVWEAGHLGQQFAPVNGAELAGRFAMPKGIAVPRLADRDRLRRDFEELRSGLDQTVSLVRTDRYQQQAFEMVSSGKVEQAFRVDDEPTELREAYGRHSLGEKALLARRLVEAGVTFVVVSAHWGYFDHHGDEVRWGGIEKGLKPILPVLDQTTHALITDLDQRGLLDDTLVLMLGEFGRDPVMTRTAGRGHWTNVMSMLVAGGGFAHGQVIGSTDRTGHSIKERPITPSDLAATVFDYLGIDLESQWLSPQGRPTPIVTEGGRPIAELRRAV
ncbi:MAG: DUF1501 domain-containing protein [Pirellulales bacterium]